MSNFFVFDPSKRRLVACYKDFHNAHKAACKFGAADIREFSESQLSLDVARVLGTDEPYEINNVITFGAKHGATPWGERRDGNETYRATYNANHARYNGADRKWLLTCPHASAHGGECPDCGMVPVSVRQPMAVTA